MTTPEVGSRLLALGWPQTVQNAKTGEVYGVVPNCHEFQRPGDDTVVARLCNETAIYDFLFRARLGGQPYPLEYARGFFDWADQGWWSSLYFVFLVRNGEGAPVACMDLKECNLERSEIGYWCSAAVSGLMTNAVALLVDVAGRVGFRNLTAVTLADNHRSQSVLLRTGFQEDGEFLDGAAKKRYRKPLLPVPATPEDYSESRSDQPIR